MRNTTLYIVLGFAVSTTCLSAPPHDTPEGYAAEPKVSADDDVLHYTGLLNQTGADKLRSVMAAHGNLRTLHINSAGGEALSSMEIGGLIHARNLDVVVLERCNSGCANYVFVPAAKKTITSGAMVVWHNACPQNIPAEVPFMEMFAGKPEKVGVGYMVEIDGREVKDEAKKAEVLEKNPAKYNRKMKEYLSRYASEHRAFFDGSPVDDRIVCLGDYIGLPGGKGYGYTLSIADMGKFGVCNVKADENYLGAVAAALEREEKLGKGGAIRMSDHPDFHPRYAQSGCADERLRVHSSMKGEIDEGALGSFGKDR